MVDVSQESVSPNVVVKVDALNSGYGTSHVLFGVDFEANEI